MDEMVTSEPVLDEESASALMPKKAPEREFVSGKRKGEKKQKKKSFTQNWK